MKGFYERFKAIILGVFYALLIIALAALVTSCKTGKVTTDEHSIDSTTVKFYQGKIDSLNNVIDKSISKELYQKQLDSIIAIKERLELTAEKDGTIVNYNNDGTIKSIEDYHVNLNGKKDTNKDVFVKKDEEYKKEIETLKDSISSLSKAINSNDSTTIHKHENKVVEQEKSWFQKFISNTWLGLFFWFCLSLILIGYYVWKRLH